jgi:hypothetical protein
MVAGALMTTVGVTAAAEVAMVTETAVSALGQAEVSQDVAAQRAFS